MMKLRVRTAPLVLLAGVAVLSSVRVAEAFPPAPHHVIHGLVRDEMGEPILLTSASVFLETADGLSIPTQLQPGIVPGENYRLIVPMDSFTASDAYKPTALRPTVPFRLKVQIGQTIYLPLEMAGNFASLGQPGGETLINLTLGVDSDGDGLPDAWEQALIAMLGGGLTLANINRGTDSDGDGVSDYNEYIAGTYAFDPGDELKLSMVRRAGQGPTLQFFGIAGRTYAVLGTTNLVNWTPMTFRLPAGAAEASGIKEHYAATSQIVEVEVLSESAPTKAMLFRIQVR